MNEVKGTFFSDQESKDHLGRPRLLIVEGIDDAWFLDRILIDMGADPDRIGILYIKGKDNLTRNISALKLSRQYKETLEKYAIVHDSDENPTSELSRIHAALTANGEPTPISNTYETSPDGKSVGLYLIPSATESGNLEKLCLSTLENETKFEECKTFFEAADSVHGPFKAKFKRIAQIYLAVTHGDSRGVGRAFYNDVFQKNHRLIDPIKSFISQLSS